MPQRLVLMTQYFNSIKVRLKLYDVVEHHEVVKFQFHKGTIKTPELPLMLKVLHNFNSIKVRLKQQSASRGIGNRLLFQFHKGTIKTKLTASATMTGAEFQFHKGTIKTIRLHPRACKWLDFNSIKVRLKQFQIVDNNASGDNFNSIKVRLKQ